VAWPQSPQPAPQPAPSGGSSTSLSIPSLVAAASGILTFFFSFVRIFKIESGGEDAGWSVWTTGFAPGLFGVGTWIPLFALLAGAIALARSLVKGADSKRFAGFSLLQLQVVALAFAVLLWLGYLVSILAADGGELSTFDFKYGLGMLLLFLGLAGLAAGTVLGMVEAKKASGSSGHPSSGEAGPWQQSGQWQQPAPAPQAQPDPGQWQQQAPPPAQPDPGQWQQPAPPPDPAQWQQQQTDPGQWQQPAPVQPTWDQASGGGAAPGQWQPDPGAPAGPAPVWSQPPSDAPGGDWQAPGQPAASPTEPQPWDPGPAPPGPQPEPGPLQPQPAPPVDPGPAPAGGLYDPGTQVIPGPPPAPPTDDPGAQDPPDGPYPAPPRPNTP